MKIYTKTGDKGTTGLFGGKRVSKADLRIEAYGTVDELNSHMGLVRDMKENSGRTDLLISIQHNLFVIGSMLAAEPGNDKVQVPKIDSSDIQQLEEAMDKMDEQLPPMKNFILPGGHPAISQAHIARTICRRAERRIVSLFDHEPGDELIIQYMNRLSDYLFMLSRMLARDLDVTETPWIPRS